MKRSRKEIRKPAAVCRPSGQGRSSDSRKPAWVVQASCRGLAGGLLLLHSWLHSWVAPAQALPAMQPVQVIQGIPLHRGEVRIGEQQIPVSAVVISPAAGRLRPLWAAPVGLVGLGELPTFSRQQGAVAAINGGFFNRNTHQPLGAIRRDGRWISSPILGRGVIAWSDGGTVRFARLRMQAELRNAIGDRIPLVGINTGYVLPGISQYTPDWSPAYTTQTDGETLLVVEGDVLQQILPAGAAGSLTLPIPGKGYLLVARGLEGSLEAQKLIPGDRLHLHITLDPPELEAYPHILGGGPLLLLDGQVVLDARLEGFQPLFARQQAARSAIGQLNSGHLLLVTAGNAQENQGLTLLEMAQLMQQLGCRHALNLDGGNSSTLVLAGEVVNGQQDPPVAAPSGEIDPNTNTPGSRRRIPRIHNGLGFFPL